MTRASEPWDLQQFGLVHQAGGIQTATFDDPQPGGRPGCRVALINTGSGLRFTVALDHGGDIVEAFYNADSLAFLTPNGYKRPSHAYHREAEWLSSWAGGLLTSCGPRHIGGPRGVGGQPQSLHGHHHNTPAAVLAIRNPDLRRGERTMSIEMTITDARMFGPVVEVHRVIQARLGEPVIEIHDRVTNLGDEPVPHQWLYHMNLGYPLVDAGAHFVGGGTIIDHWSAPSKPVAPWPPVGGDPNALKVVPSPLPEHSGGGERGLIMAMAADAQGLCRVGLINPNRKLGLAITYPQAQLPRLANWQHFGPGGSYVMGIEPFYGSLFGPDRDDHPMATATLAPGESRRYDLTVSTCTDAASLAALQKFDGDLQTV